MPRNCCVPQCPNIFKKGKNLKCHLFPNDPKRKKQWIHAIKIGRKPSKNMVVCGEHFDERDYFLSKSGTWVVLKKDSIPHLKLPITSTQLLTLSRPAIKRNSRCKRTVETTEAASRPNENLEGPMDVTTEVPIDVPMECDMAPEVKTVVSVSTQTNNTFYNFLEARPIRQENIGTQTYKNKTASFSSQTYFKRTMFSSITNLELEYLTGLDRPRFEVLFQMLEKFNPITDSHKHSNREALLIMLCKLRHNLDFKMIEYIFQINRQEASTIFKEVTEKLYDVVSQINIWDTAYIGCGCYRCIVDCTEIFVIRAEDPIIHQLTFSNYKHRPTFKVLVCCDEKGAVNFISDLFVGSIQDREVIVKSGILNKLKRGEGILADRGFDISDLVEGKGIILNIPPFLRGKKQLSHYEVMKTRIIANRRILIENVNARAKKNRILVDPMPVSLWPLANKIVYICFFLINLYKPLK